LVLTAVGVSLFGPVSSGQVVWAVLPHVQAPCVLELPHASVLAVSLIGQLLSGMAAWSADRLGVGVAHALRVVVGSDSVRFGCVSVSVQQLHRLTDRRSRLRVATGIRVGDRLGKLLAGAGKWISAAISAELISVEVGDAADVFAGEFRG
jgi:hypothetical protein